MQRILYAITDRAQYGKSMPEQRAGLMAQAERLAAEGIDYLQLREKDLSAQTVISLARELLSVLRPRTRLLINSRADVALAAGADGVHLPSGYDQLTPDQVRRLFEIAGKQRPVVSLSCHTLEDVQRAHNNQADLILFGPVFGKSVAGELVTSAVGLDALKAACVIAAGTPVLALGGVTAANAATTIAVGATGLAAIRLFR